MADDASFVVYRHRLPLWHVICAAKFIVFADHRSMRRVLGSLLILRTVVACGACYVVYALETFGACAAIYVGLRLLGPSSHVLHVTLFIVVADYRGM